MTNDNEERHSIDAKLILYYNIYIMAAKSVGTFIQVYLSQNDHLKFLDLFLQSALKMNKVMNLGRSCFCCSC